jgi:aminopeptidase N
MRVFSFCCLLVWAMVGHAQSKHYTLEDTLRGSITPQRVWWDLTYYHLKIEVFPGERKIKGENEIEFKALQEGRVMQIDLQTPLEWKGASIDGLAIDSVQRKTNYVYFVFLHQPVKKGEKHTLKVQYEGKPRRAFNPPWDGGFTWDKDKNGDDFIATSCQGLGASAWWPCKDHMYDEPDSMRISVTVPKPLMDVSSGRLEKVIDLGDRQTFQWVVKNPINNYGVNLSIAHYATFNEIYPGEKGPLDLRFYALREDETKAREQFKQVSKMLKAFENWFGPYPFYEDGYQMVQVPFLGMEHQSAVAYGNKYKNGYLGMDLSGSGWGKDWDYIIIHESGHEWFANNITYKDMADMWIHEGFTTYSEALFVEYYNGKEAGAEYIRGLRKNIYNMRPIIANYGVNEDGPGDMYYKGANLLHMIRQIKNNDERWKAMLREMNRVYYHKTVTTDDIESFMCVELGLSLKKVFDQYLRTPQVPEFEYQVEKGVLKYRWVNCIEGFDMPIDAMVNGQELRLFPEAQSWKTADLNVQTFDIDPDFYVTVKQIKKNKKSKRK